MTDKTNKALKAITEIRVANNILWMKILELALKAKKSKAKSIIKKIQKNDRRISRWMAQF